MTTCPAPNKRTPCSIHVPLYEHEEAKDAFATWPQAVQNIHTRELDLWAHRNPELDIIEQNHSIDPVRRVTITEFHHQPKAAAA